MNIHDLVKTRNDEGLTVTEMIVKRRMKLAIKAFDKRKETVIIEPIKEEINKTEKGFYNLFH